MSTPSIRSIAETGWAMAPFGNLKIVGLSFTTTDSLKSSLNVEASLGAESIRFGTTCKIDKSHIPL